VARRVEKRWRQEERAPGLLNAEQHLEWEGRWPETPEGREALAALLEREHVRSVERYALGLVRCRREDSRIVCRFPTGWKAMVFQDASVELGEERVVRRWIIEPGLLARKVLEGEGMGKGDEGAAPYGRLTLGVERRGGDTLHAWVAVAAFPSRFLLSEPPWWLRWPATVAGALYGRLHDAASFGCLRGIARELSA
jgi:hypothetical protein